MKNILYAFILSFVICLLVGLVLLPLLKKLKMKQTILCYVEEHKSKNGTPTTGGLFFLISSIVAFLIVSNEHNTLSIIALITTVSFAIVGLIDDFIKIKFSQNLGLTSIQKILFQLAISLIISIYAYNSGITYVYLPFKGNLIDLGVFSIFLNVLVFIATVNSVNLIDGLDGLCSSVSIAVLLSVTVIGFLQISVSESYYINTLLYENLYLYAITIVGGLVAFLLFNTNKAVVFMGDTGSLMIGGAISSICIFSGNVLYIPIIGVAYVVTALSVIIQVLVYKKTKKRVFIMSPLHHHFQKKGLTENKICYIYFVVTLMIAIICILCIL